ncbi:conserved hypothetical protein [Lebetimonas natsushimae]|uniref:Permease n=1 Tax=Lebetimonas natsushimae TaxID=1936991 RepID=A0A292YEY5_9BACT|nr:permease [Lebetimonas natsushimae]GAX87856.1 conserved hypothetical protein [Lebetimonas natsushimae]
MKEKIKNSLKNSFVNLCRIIPMILAVVGLVGLFKAYITPQILQKFFNGNVIHDVLMGVIAGGVSVGQPFLSYIIGGELLKEGVSLYAVTAFILSFVTLGVVQLPLQIEIFGKRFTILFNVLSFIFTIIVSIVTVWTLKILGLV